MLKSSLKQSSDSFAKFADYCARNLLDYAGSFGSVVNISVIGGERRFFFALNIFFFLNCHNQLGEKKCSTNCEPIHFFGQEQFK